MTGGAFFSPVYSLQKQFLTDYHILQQLYHYPPFFSTEITCRDALLLLGEKPFSGVRKNGILIFVTHRAALNKQNPARAQINIKLQKITKCP